MAKATWTVSLEFTSDDGEGGPSTVKMSIADEWDSDRPSRPVNECIAISMSNLMAMLLECGHIVCPSDMKGSSEAFAGN